MVNTKDCPNEKNCGGWILSLNVDFLRWGGGEGEVWIQFRGLKSQDWCGGGI